MILFILAIVCAVVNSSAEPYFYKNGSICWCCGKNVLLLCLCCIYNLLNVVKYNLLFLVNVINKIRIFYRRCFIWLNGCSFLSAYYEILSKLSFVLHGLTCGCRIQISSGIGMKYCCALNTAWKWKVAINKNSVSRPSFIFESHKKILQETQNQ